MHPSEEKPAAGKLFVGIAAFLRLFVFTFGSYTCARYTQYPPASDSDPDEVHTDRYVHLEHFLFR